MLIFLRLFFNLLSLFGLDYRDLLFNLNFFFRLFLFFRRNLLFLLLLFTFIMFFTFWFCIFLRVRLLLFLCFFLKSFWFGFILSVCHHFVLFFHGFDFHLNSPSVNAVQHNAYDREYRNEPQYCKYNDPPRRQINAVSIICRMIELCFALQAIDQTRSCNKSAINTIFRTS